MTSAAFSHRVVRRLPVSVVVPLQGAVGQVQPGFVAEYRWRRAVCAWHRAHQGGQLQGELVVAHALLALSCLVDSRLVAPVLAAACPPTTIRWVRWHDAEASERFHVPGLPRALLHQPPVSEPLRLPIEVTTDAPPTWPRPVSQSDGASYVLEFSNGMLDIKGFKQVASARKWWIVLQALVGDSAKVDCWLALVSAVQPKALLHFLSQLLLGLAAGIEVVCGKCRRWQ